MGLRPRHHGLVWDWRGHKPSHPTVPCNIENPNDRRTGLCSVQHHNVFDRAVPQPGRNQPGDNHQPLSAATILHLREEEDISASQSFDEVQNTGWLIWLLPAPMAKMFAR